VKGSVDATGISLTETRLDAEEDDFELLGEIRVSLSFLNPPMVPSFAFLVV